MYYASRGLFLLPLYTTVNCDSAYDKSMCNAKWQTGYNYYYFYFSILVTCLISHELHLSLHSFLFFSFIDFMKKQTESEQERENIIKWNLAASSLLTQFNFIYFMLFFYKFIVSLTSCHHTTIQCHFQIMSSAIIYLRSRFAMQMVFFSSFCASWVFKYQEPLWYLFG